MYIHPNSFTIKIRTGEVLNISEFIADRIPDPHRQVILDRIPPLDSVPYISAAEMEELKLGWDKPILKKIGNPPSIKILKCSEKKCYERVYCASYSYESCLLKTPKKEHSFPKCFSYNNENILLREIMTTVIHLWLENQYVFFVV